ncbi:MAG TPA: hypothetical protein VKG24_26005 [Pseudolabrys sp.]|nr:hypothetical protein [Pseudolabrys sp.]
MEIRLVTRVRGRHSSHDARRDNAALLQTSNLRFAQIDDHEVIGFIKESVARYNAMAVAVALTKAGPQEFWFHFGDIEIGPSSRAGTSNSLKI